MIVIGAGLEAELEAAVADPVMLIDLNFTTGHRRFAVWTANVVYGGVTYFTMPPIVDIGAVEAAQATPLTEQGLRFMVQGDAALLLDLLQNSRDQWADGYATSLVDGVPVNDHIHLWHRRMQPGPSISSASSDIVDLVLESRFNQRRNRAVRTYSHATQQDERGTSDFAFRDSGKSFSIARPDWVQKSGLK